MANDKVATAKIVIEVPLSSLVEKAIPATNKDGKANKRAGQLMFQISGSHEGVMHLGAGKVPVYLGWGGKLTIPVDASAQPKAQAVTGLSDKTKKQFGI